MTLFVPVPCPRLGCRKSLMGADEVVCSGDFHTLAGMCRGKKRLGETQAMMIDSCGRGVAYRCRVCVEWHNGAAVKDPRGLKVEARETVMAMKNDPRVGWQGMVNLARAWRPGFSPRMGWHQGLDQKDAYQ
jgi:hypothetical protein